ncbi:hypothetical protein BASA50_005172 [Batrachochytrium salamandrivorans]|uniref:Signal peptide peptidase n=1 Tax=Batrachochytrium salamandrivorans TaxID=1357716 RepID=A0ABQ8FGI8_9FUNG|nr:hypothetical protein BASA50_005172 [Batrachochytrium salamandrivorans]KAH9265373.1 hypothetical protein BASA84_001642 [Batrachochytrium salamandrivorans]KAJ1330628.1 hypothetical protein BSLG_009080 [Batrachochytrium salamandrivorans]
MARQPSALTLLVRLLAASILCVIVQAQLPSAIPALSDSGTGGMSATVETKAAANSSNSSNASSNITQSVVLVIHPSCHSIYYPSYYYCHYIYPWVAATQRYAALPMFNSSALIPIKPLSLTAELVSVSSIHAISNTAATIATTDISNLCTPFSITDHHLPNIPAVYLLDISTEVTDNSTRCPMATRLRNIVHAASSQSSQSSSYSPSNVTAVLIIANSSGVKQTLQNDLASDPQLASQFNIPVLLVSQLAFKSLQAINTSSAGMIGTISLFTPYPPPVVDPSVIVLFAVAVGTLFIGCCWGAWTHPLVTGIKSWKGIASLEDPAELSETITVNNAVVYVPISSATLLLIYTFPHILVYVVLLAFYVSGIGSICVCIDALVQATHIQIPTILNEPVFKQTTINDTFSSSKSTIDYLSWGNVVVTLLSTAFMTLWAVCRNGSIAWLFQDIIGMCLITSMLRVINLPNLKVATILLVGLFFYDIFWVFGSKLFTSDGKSVMESVALAVGTSETMPMLFRIPRFMDDFGSYTMLGYGDLIVPGLVVHMARALDLTHAIGNGKEISPGLESDNPKVSDSSIDSGEDVDEAAVDEPFTDADLAASEQQPLLMRTGLVSRSGSSQSLDSLCIQQDSIGQQASSSMLPLKGFPFLNLTTPSYFKIVIIGYAVGLLVAFVAVFWMHMGQPALLYLVPATLIPMAWHAFSRGELKAVWDGIDTAHWLKSI